MTNVTYAVFEKDKKTEIHYWKGARKTLKEARQLAKEKKIEEGIILRSYWDRYGNRITSTREFNL